MKTPQAVLKALRIGHWATSIDLKDPYFHIPIKRLSRKYLGFLAINIHIPIKRSSRKYLRFLAINRVWQYKVLCFGLKTAPCLFTRAFQSLAVWAGSQGIQIHVFIDVWLIVAKDRQTLLVQT